MTNINGTGSKISELFDKTQIGIKTMQEDQDPSIFDSGIELPELPSQEDIEGIIKELSGEQNTTTGDRIAEGADKIGDTIEDILNIPGEFVDGAIDVGGAILGTVVDGVLGFVDGVKGKLDSDG